MTPNYWFGTCTAIVVWVLYFALNCWQALADERRHPQAEHNHGARFLACLLAFAMWVSIGVYVDVARQSAGTPRPSNVEQ